MLELLTIPQAVERLGKLAGELTRAGLAQPRLRTIQEELLQIAQFLTVHFDQAQHGLKRTAFNPDLADTGLAERISAALASVTRSPGKPGEKREHQRIGTILGVELSIDGARISGRITDISLGGFFVDTLNIFPVDTPVEFTFSTGLQTIQGRGQVRATVEYFGMGIQFTELAAEDLEHLAEFLRRQLQ